MMEIEAGKYYRTRDGRRVGPMVKTDAFGCAWYGADDPYTSIYYYADGRHMSDCTDSRNDLIAPWSDGPVREVTRKEIVAGRYGIVQVWTDPLEVGFLSHHEGPRTPESLRAAAEVLTQLADALEPKP